MTLKSYSILAVALLALAFVGILSQHGAANAVSWASVTPLGVFVLYGVVRAITNSK